MRENHVHYVHLIDIYAPCIVGHSIWNNKTNMTQSCRDSGGLFNDFVFSQSDEAFLLLVLLNYTETWMSELTHEQSKVTSIWHNAIPQIVLQTTYVIFFCSILWPADSSKCCGQCYSWCGRNCGKWSIHYYFAVLFLRLLLTPRRHQSLHCRERNKCCGQCYSWLFCCTIF